MAFVSHIETNSHTRIARATMLMRAFCNTLCDFHMEKADLFKTTNISLLFRGFVNESELVSAIVLV